MSQRWYVVHAYSGFEQQVARLLKERIKRSGLEDSFGDVLKCVPDSGGAATENSSRVTCS